MVEFTCRRCKKTHIEPLEKHKDDSKDHYGHLRFAVKPPEGWDDHTISTWLLCPDCVEALVHFLNPTKEADQ